MNPRDAERAAALQLAVILNTLGQALSPLPGVGVLYQVGYQIGSYLGGGGASSPWKHHDVEVHQN
jgi:hypothetical protein